MKFRLPSLDISGDPRSTRTAQHQRLADSNHPVSAICAHRLSAYQLQVTGKKSGKFRW
jgi:hypothetical protein